MPARPQASAACSLRYDRRDIHDAFHVSTEDWSAHPAFWGHTADDVRTIAQVPNAHLITRTEPAKGRKLKDATSVWAKAGHILLVERLWPITHHVLAVGFTKQVLGNTWWAFSAHKLSRSREKALLLWLNSSLALLLYFGRRVTTRSAWMQMKKPAWLSMPVLDVRALSKEQIKSLASAYDKLAKQNLDALAKLDHDATRHAIDKAISDTLSLPDLAPIREQLAREPGLNAKDINPRLKQAEMFADDDVEEEDDTEPVKGLV